MIPGMIMAEAQQQPPSTMEQSPTSQDSKPLRSPMLQAHLVGDPADFIVSSLILFISPTIQLVSKELSSGSPGLAPRHHTKLDLSNATGLKEPRQVRDGARRVLVAPRRTALGADGEALGMLVCNPKAAGDFRGSKYPMSEASDPKPLKQHGFGIEIHLNYTGDSPPSLREELRPSDLARRIQIINRMGHLQLATASESSSLASVASEATRPRKHSPRGSFQLSGAPIWTI